MNIYHIDATFEYFRGELALDKLEKVTAILIKNFFKQLNDALT